MKSRVCSRSLLSVSVHVISRFILFEHRFFISPLQFQTPTIKFDCVQRLCEIFMYCSQIPDTRSLQLTLLPRNGCTNVITLAFLMATFFSTTKYYVLWILLGKFCSKNCVAIIFIIYCKPNLENLLHGTILIKQSRTKYLRHTFILPDYVLNKPF